MFSRFHVVEYSSQEETGQKPGQFVIAYCTICVKTSCYWYF